MRLPELSTGPNQDRPIPKRAAKQPGLCAEVWCMQPGVKACSIVDTDDYTHCGNPLACALAASHPWTTTIRV